MITSFILQTILVLIGCVLMWCTIHSLAKKVLTEPLSLFWGAIAILFVLAGVLLTPSGWNKYMSGKGLVLVLLGVICVLAGLFFLSVQLSYLVRKNQELAMQISLLNQEHEKLNEYMMLLTGKNKKQLWRTDTKPEPKVIDGTKDCVKYE